jgi:hypothetical protein
MHERSRDLHLRNPYSHPRTHDRIKHSRLKACARDLRLNPRPVRLNSSHGGFFPRRHRLDPSHARLASSHLCLEACHGGSYTARRSLLLRSCDFRLCQEPIGSSRSQSKHRPSAALDSFDDLTNIPASPCRAAVVINPIQSQRQNPSRQPSPSLHRFHRHNPLWQIGRASPQSVSNGRYAIGGKSVPCHSGVLFDQVTVGSPW